MQRIAPRKFVAAMIGALGLVLLAGCMFSPGKFTSTLDIRKDGRFTYAYVGEIHVLALSDFARRGSASDEFTPSRCVDTAEDGNEIERDCTAGELADQKEQWRQQQDAARKKRENEARQMRSVLGGIDPEDPKAAEELAQRLRRQAGFRSVAYKGNGLYWIDYAVTSNLTHGFAFPSVEGFPMANDFVVMAVRNDGTVRIDAPGFGASGGNPAGAMMLGAMSAEAAGAKGPPMPMPDGTFTLTTDGEVLSNNTDDGPQQAAEGKRLTWKVNGSTQAPPMALVKLSRLPVTTP
jgi:hypothetical protein